MEEDEKGGATISSMIKRFREGKPMSRKERIDQMDAGCVSEMWFIDKDNAKKRQPPASAIVVDDEPRKTAPVPNRPTINDSNFSAARDKENTSYNYNNYDPSIGIGGMRESRDSDFGLSTKKGVSDWRDNIDLRLSDSTGDIYGKGRSGIDPKKYSFDDDSFIKNALKKGVNSSIDSDYGGKGNRTSRYDSERESVDLRYSQERPTYRFKDLDLKDSTDFEEKIDGMMYYSKEMDNFRSVGKNRESLKSPFNSIDTLGSTGFKGLMMKEFGLDSKKGVKSDYDNDVDDGVYGYISKSSGEDKNGGNDNVFKKVETDLEELLKTLHAESAALNKNYGNLITDSKGNVVTKSISEITTDLQTEMRGFKAMFDHKYFEMESDEKERKKRDDTMREAGRLEERALLTMLDDIALRHPYEHLVPTGGSHHIPAVQFRGAPPGLAPGSTNKPQDDATHKPKQQADASGIMRVAAEIEYSAAYESMNKIQALRRDLGGRMARIDHLQGAVKAQDREALSRSHEYVYVSPALIRTSAESAASATTTTTYAFEEANVKDEAQHIHENITRTSKGVLTSLDEAIATLKHNIASAPFTVKPVPNPVAAASTRALASNPPHNNNGSHITDSHIDTAPEIQPPPAMNPKINSVHDIEYYTSTERYMDRMLERPRDDRFRVSRHPSASPRNSGGPPEPRSPMASSKTYGSSLPSIQTIDSLEGSRAGGRGGVPTPTSTIYEKDQFLRKMQQERMSMVRSMAFY